MEIIKIEYSLTKEEIDKVVRDRSREKADRGIFITNKKGKRVSLWDDKKKHPFKIDKELTVNVFFRTEHIHYCYSFTIPAFYVWNGADIPSFLWVLVGSKYNPEFKVPSMLHDFILEYGKDIYNNNLIGILTPQEYRKLTSEIFCSALIEYGTGNKKANVMSNIVDWFQKWFMKSNFKF